MRIGIITHPLIHNYGGILQNYALQQVLRHLGHKPITIDFVPAKDWRLRLKHIAWSYFHLKKPNKWTTCPPKRQRITKIFIRQNITATGIVRKYRARTVHSYKCNALIAGSDQIWRPKYNDGYLSDMFFKFVEGLPVRKIVYGASFGTDEWEYSPELMKTCRTLAQKIDVVSVREKSGVELCRQHFGIDAQWVLDPTLLLDKIDYEVLCERIPRASQQYVAAYLLDVDEKLLNRINEIGNSLNMPVRLFSAEKDMNLTVEEWLAMFRDANYVITDSFHGTVFSIIFNKQFISIGNESRGMGRFYSLLEQFDLENRLSDNIAEDVLPRPILWEDVNRRKQLLKDKSIRFLKDALT